MRQDAKERQEMEAWEAKNLAARLQFEAVLCLVFVVFVCHVCLWCMIMVYVCGV